MTIANYTDLKTAIETWLARAGDTAISGNAADLVTLCESRLNRKLPLRVMWINTTLTGTLGSRSIALPSDFVEPEALFITTFGARTRLTPFVAGTIEEQVPNGTPVGWCIDGANIG